MTGNGLSVQSQNHKTTVLRQEYKTPVFSFVYAFNAVVSDTQTNIFMKHLTFLWCIYLQFQVKEL